MTDTLEEARDRLDRRIEELSREYAGRPMAEVLDALEHAVCAAGVLPSRPDLSGRAREISAAAG
jgi:hypothetical protein